ncbi:MULTISPECIES: Curculin domain protein (mannose-binding) lectin [Pseudofrankia]|uniref:Curculin domain protein (mannose-binding) lectin n=1 Tax=Pseudofrankia TaxID=2994363 RepID=UPI000234C7EA|nr:MULTISPECIES: Curculin domain protein (mannose-binding) lectin [Pseudofrankia]OHV27754.1 hypothetical protein BCD49_38630 [Pseudofrankia sp. EUN1h]
MEGTTGELGFPTSPERELYERFGRGQMQRFENGAILYYDEYDAVPVTGAGWHLVGRDEKVGDKCRFPLAGPQRLRDVSTDVIQQFEGGIVTVTGGRAEFWPTPAASRLLHRLEPGQALAVRECLYSPEQHRLTLREDGNLVLYRPGRTSGSGALWASDTAGRPAEKLMLRSDGNLVLCDGQARKHWESETAGNPGGVLVLQANGVLILCGVDGTILRSWPENR